MDIGKINNLNIGNTAESSKSKAADDEFEKRLQEAVNNKDDKELKKVCNDFEGIILRMMYKEMRATVKKSDLIPNDPGRDIFESMMDDELMKEASKGAGLGLAEVLYKQLSRQSRSANNLDKGEEKVDGKE